MTRSLGAIRLREPGRTSNEQEISWQKVGPPRLAIEAHRCEPARGHEREIDGEDRENRERKRYPRGRKKRAGVRTMHSRALRGAPHRGPAA